jgi:predicted DNA binding CopG/RHH family protein
LGATPEEAVADLEDARLEWFAFAQAKGIQIPKPDATFAQRVDYNGRITLRIPRSLHQRVAQRAALEGVSLNSYLRDCSTITFTNLAASLPNFCVGEWRHYSK